MADTVISFAEGPAIDQCSLLGGRSPRLACAFSCEMGWEFGHAESYCSIANRLPSQEIAGIVIA